MPYLHIIRPINLLFIVLIQSCIKYGLFVHLDVNTAILDWQFALLVLATVAIAAAGNVINDIQDVSIDKINKPDRMIVGRKIGEKAAFNYYMILNFIGVGAGFFLVNSIDKPGLAVIFIIVSALLYMYATQWKSILLLGNTLVSILVAMTLIVMIIFDIFPAINTDEMAPQVEASKIILYYSLCACYITFIREIVKDISDVKGDKNGGVYSLVIAIGKDRTTKVVFVLGIIGLTAVLYFQYQYLYRYKIPLYYFFGAIAAPLLVFCIRTWSASKANDYKFLSLLLKVIMLLGMISILFYPLTNWQ